MYCSVFTKLQNFAININVFRLFCTKQTGIFSICKLQSGSLFF